MNNKKISIGLPTYNEEKIIYKTLENLLPILNKEFFDFEVIVIDNNSSDNCQGLCITIKFKKNNNTKNSNK